MKENIISRGSIFGRIGVGIMDKGQESYPAILDQILPK
jgi:hypothetical protein